MRLRGAGQALSRKDSIIMPGGCTAVVPVILKNLGVVGSGCWGKTIKTERSASIRSQHRGVVRVCLQC